MAEWQNPYRPARVIPGDVVGQVWPLLVLLLIVTHASAHTALVLSGGGAKGAYEVGLLGSICKSSYANSWETIVGSPALPHFTLPFRNVGLQEHRSEL
jgi:hypothetical protein